MPDHFLRGILDANATYADAFAQSDPILLQKLAKGQSPRICWLGCSDSRVSAEL
jgi:carbonic anhydrase